MTQKIKTEKKADRRFLIYIVIMLIAGFAALMSASAPVGYAKFNDTYYFVKHQFMFGFLPGALLFLILARIDYRKWRRFSWLIYIFSLLLLILVFVPGIGTVANSSRSWLNVMGYSFQPAELAKLGLIIILSYLLTEGERDWSDWKQSLLPILFFTAPVLILVLAQPDIGTLSIMIVVIFFILFLAKVPKLYLTILFTVCALAFFALVLAAPYRVQRITTFLHPELDPKGVGYQMNQAFLAVGSGGFWGKGFGHSRQKFQYLPEVSADSIYAVIAEETGFIISAGLVALVLLIGWRGLRIAKAAPDDYGKFLVTGVMVWFLCQSFLNIGAMVGAMPLTGVPLPLVSHGGSAMMTIMAALGIVAGVSRTERV